MKNRREAVLAVLDTSKPQETIPAAFFLHFDPQVHRGRAAVEKHMEFFRYTGMDFVKIQYELPFPRHPEIQRPEEGPRCLCTARTSTGRSWRWSKAGPGGRARGVGHPHALLPFHAGGPGGRRRYG